MSQSAVALAFSFTLAFTLSACATTPGATAATQQATARPATTEVCKMVSDEALGSKITVHKECTKVAASAAPAATPKP